MSGGVEVGLAGCPMQCTVEIGFGAGVAGEVGDVSAGRADEMVVVFGEFVALNVGPRFLPGQHLTISVASKPSPQARTSRYPNEGATGSARQTPLADRSMASGGGDWYPMRVRSQLREGGLVTVPAELVSSS